MVLVLFDVDGTLLRSRGVGLKSMQEAIRIIHGAEVDPSRLQTGGRLDHHLFRELLELGDLPADPVAVGRLQDVYIDRMRHHFRNDTWSNSLQGAHELVRRVHEDDTLCSAVLTGNIEETCRLKLVDAGFEEDWFEFGVYGDEGTHRRELPAIGLDRYRRARGEELSPERAVIIGDTPHDVDCALHCGCRVIGVSTGMTSRETLEESGAGLVVDSLVEHELIIDWMKRR